MPAANYCRALLQLLWALGLLSSCQSQRVAFQVPSAMAAAHPKPLLTSTVRLDYQPGDSSVMASISEASASTKRRLFAASLVRRDGSTLAVAAFRPTHTPHFQLVNLPVSVQWLQKWLPPPRLKADDGHPAASRAVSGGFEPSILYILGGVALLVFLIAKFPVVMLVILGALLVGGLILLLSLFSGHYSYG